MTKEEIILETVIFYGQDPKGRRSLVKLTPGGGEKCRYRGDNGSHCAFGRCCTPKYLAIMAESKLANEHMSNNNQEILQEQYRGHHGDFWREIQRLHDSPWLWNTKENGLSADGIKAVTQLLLGGTAWLNNVDTLTPITYTKPTND